MANLQEDLKKNKNRTELLKRAVEEKKSAAQAAKDIKTATEKDKKTKLPTKKTGTSSIKKPTTVVKNGVTGLSYDTNPYSKEKVAAFWDNLATGDDKFGKRYAGFGQGIVDATAAIPNLIGSLATGKEVNLQQRTGLNVPSEALRATPEFKQGQFVGELTGYATQNIAAAPAINKLLAGTKLANGGFKSAMARNAIEAGTVGLAQNLGIANQQGLTGADMAKDVAINTAIDLGLGGVAESLPFALDAVKARRAAKSAKNLPTYAPAKEVPETAEKVAVKATESPVEVPKTEKPKGNPNMKRFGSRGEMVTARHYDRKGNAYAIEEGVSTWTKNPIPMYRIYFDHAPDAEVRNKLMSLGAKYQDNYNGQYWTIRAKDADEATLIKAIENVDDADVKVAESKLATKAAEPVTEVATVSGRTLKPGGADVAKSTDSIEEIRKKYETFEGSDVPKRTDLGDVQQGARTIRNSDILDDEAIAALEEGIRQGDYWKTTITNKSALEEAEAFIAKDLNQATASFQAVLTEGKQATSKDIAKGYKLAQKYIEAKDYDMVESILADVSAMESEAGRTLQAMRIFSNLSPAGRVKSALRGIDKLSASRGVEVKVNQKLLDDIYNATTDAEIAAANKAFAVDVWNQIPATFSEKMNAWRYLAMLGNPKTHIRNVLGNVIYQPARMLSDSIAAVTERAMKGRIQRLSGGEVSGSKAFVGITGKDAEYREAAKKAYKDNKASIEAVTSKFNEQHRPSEARVYKFKPLEGARQFNSKALEKEDNAFKQLTFTSAFAQYLKANKINPSAIPDDVMEKAVNYAHAQSLKATYQDSNRLADAISKFKRKFEYKATDDKLTKAGKTIGHQVAESTLPFVKTPTNILKRGFEYSPVGLLGGMGKIALAKNADDLLKGIEYFSQGLTGSALIGLGYYMARKGWINGSMGDYDKKYVYDQMLGEQSYSVNTENGTYTVDWLAPLSMPFFVGVEAAGLLGGSEGVDPWKVFESLSNLTEPVFEMSMLSGLENTFDVTFSSDSKVKAILENSLEGYLSQFIPTISGQLARTITPERKMNLSTAETKSERAFDKYLDKLQNRIPGVTEWNEPYIDQWGRTDAKRTTGDYWLAAAENFLSPGYYSERNLTPVDKELAKLYEALGETDGAKVIPAVSSTAYKQTFDGTEYYMTEKEFTQYKVTVGQASYSGLKNLFASEDYKKATTDDKRKMVEKVYDAAKEKGEEQYIVGSKIATKDEYAYSKLSDNKKEQVDSFEKAGMDFSTYQKVTEKVDTNTNGRYSLEELYAYLDGNTKYNKMQKAAIVDALNGAKSNKYKN